MEKSNYRITKILKGISPTYRNKLFSMGMLPGAEFEVLGIAPLGDPIAVKINDTRLSIRKSDMKCLKLGNIS
jgi:ferrous iron transport protein A